MLEIASFVALSAIVYLIRQVSILSNRISELEKITDRLNDKIN